MILHCLDDGCRAGGGEEVAAKIVTLQLPESWNVRRVWMYSPSLFMDIQDVLFLAFQQLQKL